MMTVRALRGATTVDQDSTEQVTERVQLLLKEMIAKNNIEKDDIISIIFTATEDIVSMFPAAAARGIGFGDISLLCAKEMSVKGSVGLCIRILLHLNTNATNQDLHHIYQYGAKALRDDLKE